MSGIAGMDLIVPSSVVNATLGENGKITWSSETSVSINGCFTSDYYNYLLVGSAVNDSANGNFQIRWRASGSDASGSDYTFQSLNVYGATISGGRSTSNVANITEVYAAARSAFTIYVYSPMLNQSTISRSLCVSRINDGGDKISMRDFSVHHTVASQYDGMTLLSVGGSSAFSGTLTIYGLKI